MGERISGFFFGLIFGAILCYVGLKYHVVRADDGIHFVAKINAEFSDAYTDIREFTISDWDNHRGLALALAQADKSSLLEKSASASLQQSVDGALQMLRGRDGR